MIGIDIGNTAMKIAFFKSLSCGHVEAYCLSNHNSDPTIIARVIHDFCRKNTTADAAHKTIFGIASVVPSLTEVAHNTLSNLIDGDIVVLQNTDSIMPHKLTTPESTGVDRFLAGLAGSTLYKKDSATIIVQAGSAITVDVVDNAGVFCGGFILPGARMWLKALATAAKLPNLSLEVDTDDFGKLFAILPSPAGLCTKDAILNGMANSLWASVKSCIYAHNSPPARVVFTGGYGGLFARLCGDNSVYDRDLVLQGIRLAVNRMQTNTI